jgi:hypothetical protein
MSGCRTPALVAAGTGLIVLVGGATPAAAATSGTTICQLPAIGGVCSAATAPVGAAAGAVTDGVLGALRTAVINGCVWAVTRVITGLGSTSQINLTSGAVTSHYRFMAAVGVVCMLPLIALAVLHAILRADPTAIARAVFGALPAAALLTLVGVQITQTLASVVDDLSAQLLASQPDPGTAVAHAIPAVLGASPLPVFIGLVVGMAAICAALAVWIELLVRAAAVEVAVMFLPLFFAGIVWPTTARYARRLAEILGALIISKLIIIGIVSLGVSELISGDISGVLAGTAMLGLAAFAPFVLLSLIPVAIDAGHMSQQRRQTLSVTRAAREVATPTGVMWQLRAPEPPSPARPAAMGAPTSHTPRYLARAQVRPAPAPTDPRP